MVKIRPNTPPSNPESDQITVKLTGNGRCFPGETIGGEVSVNFTEERSDLGVFLCVKGVEFTAWEENSVEMVDFRPEKAVKQRRGLNCFLNFKQCLVSTGEKVTEGNTVFPFFLTLPKVMLWSVEFNETGKKGGIRYSLTVEIEGKAGNIRCKPQKLVISPKIDPNPVKIDGKWPIKTCFCIEKGDFHCVFTLEKSIFTPGETIKAKIRCDCSNSLVGIKGCILRLVRTVILRTENDEICSFTDNLCEKRKEWRVKGLTLREKVPFFPVGVVIPNSSDCLGATANGSIVKIGFTLTLDIIFDNLLAFQAMPHLELPLTLSPPNNPPF